MRHSLKLFPKQLNITKVGFSKTNDYALVICYNIADIKPSSEKRW